jgi:two-component system sensor histidine kinase MtrB
VRDTGRHAEARGGFRRRLTLVVIGLVAATVVVLTATSYLLVRASLRNQLIDDATSQTQFNVGVLASAALVPDGAGRADFERAGLAERFEIRGAEGVYVDFGDGDPYASDLAFLDAPAIVGPEFQGLVADRQLAYRFVAVKGSPYLATGTDQPGGGPEFIFFFTATELDRALARLSTFMTAGGVAVLIIALLAARSIAARVLRPVGLASEAAGRAAAGDLSTRVPVESEDEFGRFARSFNQMAVSLGEKIDELEEAQARERRFAADVSHELRTPLTGLMNEAALLEAHLGSLPDPARRAGELLIGDIARLRRMVDDLLEMSRLDAGVADADLVETDLGRFVAAIVAERHPQAVWAVEPDLPPLRLDRRGLERVLGNLLDNARIHAPGAAVEMTATLDGSMLTMTVSDEGPGVPESELKALFDRFSMVDNARSGGSGLGLAIARGHAVRMSGDLVVSNRSPHGLVFELRMPVTVPLHAGEPPESYESDDEAEANEPGRKP